MADKPAPTHTQLSTVFDKSHTTTPTSANQSGPVPFSPSFFSYLHSRSPVSPMASNSLPIDTRRASMAPPPRPALSMEPKKFDINSLMSPPDALLDSFTHTATVMKRNLISMSAVAGRPAPAASTKQPLPMSPPVSPYSKPATTATATNASPRTSISNQQIKDPVLYPTDEISPTSPAQPPLFAPAELEHRRIVDEHVRARSDSIFAGVAPPRREDYELALTFRSQVMKHYTTDRKAWLRKERALLEADRRAGAQRYHTIMPAKPITVKPAKSQRADRINKNQGAPRQIRNNAAAINSATAALAAPVRSARPAGRVSATPEPSRRIVAPNREDKDFGALPDYCPPIDSLPDRPNSLKVDWKGQPIDLSGDPNARLLHPDEVSLAGNLRLDCATYLTSKRRIFERRLQCLRTGKEFRKTDAQQACKIDVNKASKLWTAFDKVGWLDALWVSKFL